MRIHQKGDLCNSLRIKLLRLEGETYKFTLQSKLQRQSLDTKATYTS